MTSIKEAIDTIVENIVFFVDEVWEVTVELLMLVLIVLGVALAAVLSPLILLGLFIFRLIKEVRD